MILTGPDINLYSNLFTVAVVIAIFLMMWTMRERANEVRRTIEDIKKDLAVVAKQTDGISNSLLAMTNKAHEALLIATSESSRNKGIESARVGNLDAAALSAMAQPSPQRPESIADTSQADAKATAKAEDKAETKAATKEAIEDAFHNMEGEIRGVDAKGKVGKVDAVLIGKVGVPPDKK